MGGERVIDGQKVWNSAHPANWIFLLARTDSRARGHRGISFLLCPLDAPGIEIRPIRELTGDSDFNEVFFTGARTPANLVVGAPGEGWEVAMTLLEHERGEEAATNPILFRAELDRLLALAAEHGRDHDPLIRQRLAWCYARVEIMRYLGYRILTQVRPIRVGPIRAGPNRAERYRTRCGGLVAKLYWLEYRRGPTELALDIGGLAGRCRKAAVRCVRCVPTTPAPPTPPAPGSAPS